MKGSMVLPQNIAQEANMKGPFTLTATRQGYPTQYHRYTHLFDAEKGAIELIVEYTEVDFTLTSANGVELLTSENGEVVFDDTKLNSAEIHNLIASALAAKRGYNTTPGGSKGLRFRHNAITTHRLGELGVDRYQDSHQRSYRKRSRTAPAAAPAAPAAKVQQIQVAAPSTQARGPFIVPQALYDANPAQVILMAKQNGYNQILLEIA
jgi:hypothetical protein